MRLNATEYKTSDDFGDFKAPLPGRYHAVCTKVDDTFKTEKGTSMVVVDFEVLNGTMPNQHGTEIRAFLPISGADEKKTASVHRQLIKLAISLKLMNFGEERDIDWQAGVARDLIIEVVEDTYEGKKRAKIAFGGFYSTDDEKHADVPRGDVAGVHAAAAAEGAAVGQSGGQGGASAKPATMAAASASAKPADTWASKEFEDV